MKKLVRFPGQFQQCVNFFRSLWLLRNLNLNPRTLKPILIGLLIIIPDEVKKSRFLERTDLLKIVQALLDYQLALNDLMDFVLSGRNNINGLIKKTRERVNKNRKNLDLLIDKLGDLDEKILIRKITDNCIDETWEVEKYVRRITDKLDLSGAIEYRRIVNAIAICSVISVIFGRQSLEKRLYSISKNSFDWDNINKKYQWVFGNSPKNSIEKAVIVMDRITTMAQLDDDWSGRHIDALLRVPSTALIALKETGNDENAALKRIQSERKRFVKKAKEQRLVSIAVDVVNFGFRNLMKLEETVTVIGRKYKRLYLLLKEIPVIKSRLQLPPREEAYILGKI